ncbi:unnamed protein product [Prunus brigantina]
MFKLQGRLCRIFSRKSHALTPFEERGYLFKEGTRHGCDAGVSAGFISGFVKNSGRVLVRVFYIMIFVVQSFWSEHSSILEQRLELEIGDRDRCGVLLVLKSLSTVETGC